MNTQAPAAKTDNRPSSMFFWPVQDRPIAVRGEGIMLWDEDGKAYIDACCGPQTTNIGHAHPYVVAKMHEQMKELNFVFRNFFKNEQAERLAHRLGDYGAAKGLDMAFFSSGGSEAVETAVKLARSYAVAKGDVGRYKMISRLPSYHGGTMGSLALTGDPEAFSTYAPMLVNHPKVDAPYCSFHPSGKSPEEAAIMYADQLETIIINQGPSTVLAFIFEPIGGVATGALIAPDIYYNRVREICDRHGVMVIYDEVMCGAGRSGKYLAAEHWDAKPDIIAMAKGLAAGYAPLGATIARREMVEAVDANGGFPHGHTYSANPTSCAAGNAVLDVMENENLVENAARMGAVLKDGLTELAARFPFIGEVRGKGLKLGFDVLADRVNRRPLAVELNAYQRISQACADRGLLIYSRRMMGGIKGDNFLVTPPLNVTSEQVDKILSLLGDALDAVAPDLLTAMD